MQHIGFHDHCWSVSHIRFFTLTFIEFSLTWSLSMFFNQTKWKRMHKNRVQFPEDWFRKPTWLPFLCLGTATWPLWRHVKTLHGVRRYVRPKHSVECFAPDVTATMLVYRKIPKGSFWNLTLLLCKTCSIFCYCFVYQHGRLITCVKTLYCLFVFHDSLFNLASKSLLSLFLGIPIFGRIRWSHSHYNSSSKETYDRFVRMIYSVLWSFKNVLVCFILITSLFDWDHTLYLVSILPRF